MKQILGVLFVAATTLARASDYYVAVNGSDANAGTFKKPFGTIQKAAGIMQAGDSCFIRSGTYRETVVPANSGQVGAPIVFQPYKNESVIISGTEVIADWQADAGKVYRAQLPGDFFKSQHNQADQVFVDGRMVNLSRWPNISTDISRPQKSTLSRDSISKSRSNEWTTVVFEDDNLEPKTDGYYVGMEICVQPNKDAWSWELTGTVVAQTGNRLTIRSRNNCGKDGDDKLYPAGSRYFIFNSRKLLDAPGEWFHDKEAGNLFLQTPSGDRPDRHIVEAKKREFGFNLENRSYITIKGIQLFACTITTDPAAGGDGIPYNPDGTARYPWRGKDSGIASADHIVLDGIDAKYLSHFTDVSGHFFLQWGQGSGIVLSGSDCILQNSRLQFSAGNGVVVLGRRNQVLNNYFFDMDYSAVECAAINTGGSAVSEDHEFAYNTIVRSARSGITPRGLKNSNPTNLVARIHHNDISESMLQDWDGGGIYTAVGDGKFVRMDHNLVHDILGFTGSGIYADWSKNYIIDHNVIWNLEWGIHLQAHADGLNNTFCYNNTIAVRNTSGSPYGPFGFANSIGKNTGTIIRNNIVYCQNPSASKGYKPVSDDFEEAEIKDNLFWDSVAGSATAPRFVAADKFDFQLQLNSPARSAGVVVPKLVRDGITVPGFNEAADGKPDLGAFEFGSQPWRAGVNSSPSLKNNFPAK